MFTFQHIEDAAKKVKSGKDFPQLVQDLKAIGVVYYENYVTNGQTIYFGKNDFQLVRKPKYPALHINYSGSSEKLKYALSIHQQGQTDYFTFCQQSAKAGVEKWITHMEKMTVAYLDKAGNVLVIESIPQPA